MALYGKKQSTSLDNKDMYFRSMIDDFHDRSFDENKEAQTQSFIDSRFECGDTDVYNEIYNIPGNRSKWLSINNIRPLIAQPAGYQREHRNSIIASPQDDADSAYTDQLTKLMMWNNKKENLNYKISNAFQSALISGISYLFAYMDYTYDQESGDLRWDLLRYDQVLIDPFFKDLSLKDCSGFLMRNYITKDIAISIYPEQREEIEMLHAYDTKDDRFQFMPQSYQTSYKKDVIAYDQFYYQDLREQQMVIDQESGSMFEWEGPVTKKLRQLLKDFPQLSYKKSMVPTVKLAAMLNGKCFYDDMNPIGLDTYPLVPVVAYFNPDAPTMAQRLQGLVRGLRDPQFLLNRRRAIEFDMAESRATNQVIFKASSLDNPDDINQTGQGKSVSINKSGSIDDIKLMPYADIPPGFFQLSENIQNDMYKILGNTEINMGAASDSLAGISQMLSQGAAMVVQKPLFDALDYSSELIGRMQAKALTKNFTAQKIARIINEEPDERFFNKSSIEYDIVIEQGFNTSTQKQLAFAQMLQMQNAGVQIPQQYMVEAAPIQNKRKIIESIQKQQEQESKEKEKQFELEMMKLQAEIKMAEAQALSDTGHGMEYMSRIQENQQEAVHKAAEAEEERTQARLNNQKGILEFIKAVNELDSLQLDNLIKWVQAAQTYEGYSQQAHQKDMGAGVKQQMLNNQLEQLNNNMQERSGVSQEQV